jgi:hypothetical protein
LLGAADNGFMAVTFAVINQRFAGVEPSTRDEKREPGDKIYDKSVARRERAGGGSTAAATTTSTTTTGGGGDSSCADEECERAISVVRPATPLEEPLLDDSRAASSPDQGGVETAYGLLFFCNASCETIIFLGTPLLVDKHSGRSSSAQYTAQVVFVACVELAALAAFVVSVPPPGPNQAK